MVQYLELSLDVDQISRTNRSRIEEQLRSSGLPVTDANVLRVYQSPNFRRATR